MQKIRKPLRNSRVGVISFTVVLSFCLLVAGCGGAGSEEQEGNNNTVEKPVLVMADVSWDSVKVHNRIAGFIIEKGYGYPECEYVFCETLPALQGLQYGDLDIYMEVWADNIIDAWNAALEEGTVKDLGSNFPDAPQGWYVPTYMITGDPDRGIEAVAPDLKSVSDLPKYQELFKDPEVPTKGRFYNSPPGWKCTEINEYKFAAYGLNDTFNLFSSGSDTALAASMATAYEKGEPWVGYYWEPTWVMGKLDMTLLEEPVYDESLWSADGGYACAYPAAKVLIGINSEMENTSPEVIEFLNNYDTTLGQNNDFLAFMMDNDGDVEKAAIYFLRTYPEVWKSWVPEDVANKVEAVLEGVD